MAIDPRWYLRRLGQMNAREVAGRAKTMLTQRRWRHKMGQNPTVSAGARPAPATLPAGWVDKIDTADREALISEGDSILAGSCTWLGETRSDLANPDWHADGFGGPTIAATYAFRVPVRDPAAVGSIKGVWELNRHQHLTTVAGCFALTGDEKYARFVADQLGGWLASNPFMVGCNWLSGIELGVRLISWAWTRRLLDGWDGAAGAFEKNPAFASSVEGHLQFLLEFESQGSSANNHVLAEAAGLVVGGHAFAWAPSAQVAQRHGTELLTSQLAIQNFDSGVNRELASSYHGFVMELAVAAAAEINAAGNAIPPVLSQQVAKMADAYVATLDQTLREPRQGDSDDGLGYLVDPGAHSRSGRSRVAVAAAMVPSKPWWPSVTPDIRAIATSALVGEPFCDAALRPNERPDVFEDAGMVIFRGETPAGDALWCRFDAGPFAFLPIGSHAHSDQLSLELRLDGIDIVADPGTLTYRPDAAERALFRSSMAHSTLQIGTADQATAGGAFLWSDHPETSLVRTDWEPGARGGSATGSHNGHAPAQHTRRVTVDLDQSTIRLNDSVRGGEGEQVRMRFPLGPSVSCTVDVDADTARFEWATPGGTKHALVDLDPKLDWTVTDTTPDALGRYAASFGVSQPASTLVGSGVLSDPTTELGVTFSLVTDG